MLEIGAALSTIAQIGVTIPGFAAVITSLRHEPAGLTPAERVGFVLMLALASIAVVGALLPFALDGVMSDGNVWRSCSMFLFATLAITLTYGMIQAQSRRGTDSAPRRPRMFIWTAVLFSVVAVAQVFALRWPVPGWHLGGLIAAVCGAGFQVWVMIWLSPDARQSDPAEPAEERRKTHH
ncbi:hypothetical protein ACFOW4_00515 [Micromonospora sp. GCM10011542]|uniref:hypothetical protein n=1 Tax=Micromonospora sp. GCM10011542 TaxID=3317337 RepID=UPI0036118DE7